MSKTADSAAPDLTLLPAVANFDHYPVLRPTGDIKAVIAANLEGESLGFSDLERIKVPSGGTTVWEIPTVDGIEEVKEFEGIIALVKTGRSYWEKEFTGEGSPPDCFSADSVNGSIPRQGNNFGPCESCALNKYESARNGLGKACKEVRSVFVVAPGTFLPIVLNVPPTGLKDFKKYRLRLANVGMNVNHVTTKFTLVKDKNQGGITYSKIVFAKGDVLSDAQANQIDSYIESLRPVFERVHRESVQDGNTYDAETSNANNPYND